MANNTGGIIEVGDFNPDEFVIDEERKIDAIDPKFNEQFEVTDFDLDAVSEVDKHSKLYSTLQGVFQGVSMGWADEAEALGRSIIGGTSYDDEVREVRKRYEEARKANTVSYYIGEFGSALLPGAGWLGAIAKGAKLGAKATTLAGKAASAAKTGALYGAVGGAGYGEEVEGKLAGAAGGLLIGSMLSAGASATFQGAVAAVSKMSKSRRAAYITEVGNKVLRGDTEVNLKRSLVTEDMSRQAHKEVAEYAESIQDKIYSLPKLERQATLYKISKVSDTGAPKFSQQASMYDIPDTWKGELIGPAVPTDWKFITFFAGVPENSTVRHALTRYSEKIRELKGALTKPKLDPTDDVQKLHSNYAKSVDEIYRTFLIMQKQIEVQSNIRRKIVEEVGGNLRDRGIDVSKQLDRVKFNIDATGNPIFSGLRTATHNMYRIDSMHGDYSLKIHLDTIAAERDAINAGHAYIVRAQKLARQAKKNLSQEEYKFITDWTRQTMPDVPKLNARQLKYYGEINKITKELHDFALEHGLNPKFVADYMPSQYVSLSKASLWARTTIAKLTADGQPIKWKENGHLKSILNKIGVKDANKKSTSDLVKELRGLMTRYKSDDIADIAPVHVITRKEEAKFIEALRETDLETLLTNYVRNTTRAAYMSGPLREMRALARRLEAAGDTNGAAYIADYMRKQVSGVSKTYAYMQGIANDIRATGVMLRDSDNMLVRGVGKGLESGPDFLAWSLAQVYPNYLGYNLTAPIRNMTQTWLIGAADMGGWGIGVTGQAWSRAMKAKFRDGVEMPKFLQARSRTTIDVKLEETSMKYIADGLHEVPGLKQFMHGIGKLGEWGMKLYRKSDEVNRFVTWHVGEVVAEQLAKKGASATKYLAKLPVSIRRDAEVLIERGQVSQLKDLMSRYLTERHQFSYSRADLSKFGKDLGMMFTTFSKWPTVIGSSMEHMAWHNDQAIQAVSQISGRYLAPLALLWGADLGLQAVDMHDNQIKRVTLGNSLANWAPVGSVTDISLPPAVASLSEFGMGNYWAGVRPFVPGMFADELAKDLSILFTGSSRSWKEFKRSETLESAAEMYRDLPGREKINP